MLRGSDSAVAQAVASSRLPTATARVQSQVRSCGIYGGNSKRYGTFSSSSSVSPGNSHHTK
jgi:hypothetical protein